MCYFTTFKDEDPRGSVFLKDVTSIDEDEDFKSFTLHATSRIITLEAQTRAEHRMWLNGIVHFCPHSSIVGIRSVDLSSVQARRNNDSKEDSKLTDETLHKDKEKREKDRERDPKCRDREKEKEKRDDHRREDHRKSHNSDYPTNATSRLHEYIRRDEKPSTQESEEESLEALSVNDTVITQSPMKAANLKPRDTRNDDGIEELDLGTTTVRKFRALRDNLDDDERETSGLDDSDLNIRDVNDKADNIASMSSSSEQKSCSNDPVPVAVPVKIRTSRDVDFGHDVDVKAEAKEVISMDQYMRQSKITLDTSLDGDDKEDDVSSILAEKKKYLESKSFSEMTQNRLKPPSGARPVASSSLARGDTITPHSAHYQSRTSTPPRKPVDPGITVDKNFVDDDWDEDSPTKKGSNSSVKTVEISGPLVGNVRPDSDWLEADFDD